MQSMPTAPVRLVDDRNQLLIRIVLCPCLSSQRHDTTGTTHLDQLSAVLDLVPHGLSDLVDTVGDALLDGELQNAWHERSEHRRVEVSAGRGYRVTGRHHTRALDPARVDRLAQRDIQQVTACLDEQSEVAHGGEPRAQRAAGIADCTQHSGRGIVLHLGQSGILAAPAHQEVDLHVHQPGQEDGLPEIDDLSLGLASDADDPVVFDTNDPRPDDLAGFDVE